MKKASILALLILAWFNTAQALPMYYTFEGYVNQGVYQTHTILLDFFRQGETTDDTGQITVLEDYEEYASDGSGGVELIGSNDYIYADYISGDFDQPDETAESNYAVIGYARYVTHEVDHIYLGSPSNPFHIVMPAYTDWVVGREVYAVGCPECGHRMYQHVTITDISPAPVPEPATLVLMSCGLGVLIRRKVRKK